MQQENPHGTWSRPARLPYILMHHMTVVGRLNSSDKLWFAHTLKKWVTLVLWVRQFIFYFASNFSPRPWNPFKLLVLTNPLHVHDLCKIARFYLFIYALFMPFLLSVKMQFLPIMYPFEYNASYHCFWDLRRERHFDQNWISAGVGRNWPSVCSSLSHLLYSEPSQF